MAKTIFLNNSADIVLGYEVSTTVAAASAGGGETKVYPAAIQSISVNMLLAIEGIGQKTVTSVGSDGGGSYFTFGGEQPPAFGAHIQTPWNSIGSLLYTRAANTIRLNYNEPAEHDLYFATQKTSDSGAIHVVLDGIELAGSPFFLTGATIALASVLLKAGVSAGSHEVIITAEITPPDESFVYFDKIELLEHIRQTGGFYSYLGPRATIEDSTCNFVGDWNGDSIPGYAFTGAAGASVFFYPQLGVDGQIKMRVQKTPDSGIVALYKDGAAEAQIDLYASPAQGPVDITLLTQPPAGPEDTVEIELRVTGNKNSLSTGTLFYFRGSVVIFSRTDLEALTLAANYLRRVGEMRGDGAFLDAYDSDRINFDANSLYACMGLLAAYEVLGDQEYLDVVKNFLTWLASMQVSAPGSPFDDGHWKIGYRVNPDSPPAYVPAIAPYDAQGISEIRWVDAVQCLPAFVLWWYWKQSGDDATRDALLPAFRKGIDGFITNNYDPNTGFFYSSWQNKRAPTIFLYHDAIRRFNASGVLVEQHDDAETDFVTYSPATNWSSYSPAGALGAGEHFTLVSPSTVEFALWLNAGDTVAWLTQTAWDVGIAEILVSSDGATYAVETTVDGYSPSIVFQRQFPIYTATGDGLKYFRIRHSGTINAAANATLGWQRLSARYAAGQTDVLLGLTGLWLLSGGQKYAQLAIQILRRFGSRFWSAAENRWYVALEGAAPGTGNDFWYPFAHGYSVFGMNQSRYFTSPSLLSEGLQALEPFQDDEGGFLPPGYAEPEHIFSAFYVVGENQLAVPTDPAKLQLAREYIKGGQYFLTLAGQQVGGIVFSKRYPYLYSNISGFACLALSGARNPITEQLLALAGTTRLIMPQ